MQFEHPGTKDSAVRIGTSDLYVRPIGLGVWPIAGVTSLGVTDDASAETIRHALRRGINHIDSAYSYGIDGRSDRVIASVLAGLRSANTDTPGKVVLASKVGAKLDAQGVWKNDARPEAMLAQTQEILERLGVESVDLMYLHAPDPSVPLEESADALREVVNRGWAKWAGVSNVNLEQAQRFHQRCPVVAIQTYFNMFQQDSVEGLRSFCQSQSISLVVYWVLMKGLLAGAMERDHVLAPEDRRRRYPIYQGEQWQAAQDLLDKIRSFSKTKGWTVSQSVIAWTLTQPGIDVALVGAKRAEQIDETSQAMGMRLSEAENAQFEGWIAECRQRGQWAR